VSTGKDRQHLEERENLQQFLKSATGLVGLGLFAYLFIFFAWDGTKIASWQKSGTARSRITLTEDSVVVFQQVDSADFAATPFPQPDDTLLTIADSAASRDLWIEHFSSPREPWREVAISFVQNGDTLTAHLVPRPPRISSAYLVILLQCLRFLITFLYLVVALWAFFKRPDSAAVRVLALFCFSMAALMISSVAVLPARYATFDIPLENLISEALDFFSSLFGSFWVHLAFLFPHPIALMKRRPALAHVLCYLPVALVLAAYAVVRFAGITVDLTIPLVLLFASQVFGGLVVLMAKHLRTVSSLERRQTRLVIWGSGFGLAVLISLIVVATVLQQWFLENPQALLITINAAFAALLLSPISFAYAFGRYRLLEVEARLRRGTRYVLGTVILVAAMTAVGFALGTFARQNFGEKGGTLAVLVAMLAAIGVFPLVRAARGYLERQLYPERQRLRGMFRDFLEQAFTVTDSRAFWRQIEERFAEGLSLRGVVPVVRSQEDGRLFLCRGAEVTPFLADSLLIEHLQRERRPLMVDEALASSRVPLSLEESVWLTERRIVLVVPLITHSGIIGFLGLGSKREQDDYAAEELRILGSLASQVALASENIRLIEENVGKRRLEEQLEMARRIQYKFLPTDIPPTPALELAARSRFCLEVAGDYYDIIPLETGETVLAVGDVSGKGAGAALLMANLQASLRTAVGMGVPLRDVVARINDLTYRNTPPEEYITFFVGVYDPQRRRFRYVNAGHNPPLLRRASGQIETLDVGGLLLGVIPGATYEQGEIAFAPRDLLLLYTDGVSEAMNAQEEEFGEARIRQILQRADSQPTERILTALEEEVIRHRSLTTFEDDFTLLLARAK